MSDRKPITPEELAKWRRLATVAVAAAERELDEARAGAAAMRAVLAEIADAAAQVLADDCRWHHSGSGCNGECIWSHVHAALATTAGRDALERRRRAEAKIEKADALVTVIREGGEMQPWLEKLNAALKAYEEML